MSDLALGSRQEGHKRERLLAAIRYAGMRRRAAAAAADTALKWPLQSHCTVRELGRLLSFFQENMTNGILVPVLKLSRCVALRQYQAPAKATYINLSFVSNFNLKGGVSAAPLQLLGSRRSVRATALGKT